MHVLEAMSGSGRLQIPLLQKGFSVDGVDNSASMLKQCEQRLHELKLTAKLYQQNVAAMQVDQKYDTIIIAKGSFQLLDKSTAALQTLRTMHAHLQPHGTLLLEFFTPDQTLNNQQISSRATIDEQTAITFTRSYNFDREAQTVQVACSYKLLRNGIGFLYAHQT